MPGSAALEVVRLYTPVLSGTETRSSYVIAADRRGVLIWSVPACGRTLRVYREHCFRYLASANTAHDLLTTKAERVQTRLAIA